MSYAATDTDRRLGNVIQMGRISAVDPAKGLVQVDFDGATTDWIPWTAPQAGGNRTWSCPDVGEQVVVAAPSGELGNAVVIGSLFQDAHAEPSDNADISRTIYKDGTVVEYDRAGHVYKIDLSASSGSVVIVCKTANVQASESATIDTPETTITGNATIQGGLTVAGTTTLANVTSNGKNVGSNHQHANSGGSGTGGVPI